MKGALTAYRLTQETIMVDGVSRNIVEIKRGEKWYRFWSDEQGGLNEIVQPISDFVTAKKLDQNGIVIQSVIREEITPLSDNTALLCADVENKRGKFKYIQLWKKQATGDWGTYSQGLLSDDDFNLYNVAIATFWADMFA